MRRDPQAAVHVFVEVGNIAIPRGVQIVRDAVFSAKLAGLPVEYQQSILSAHPEVSGGVFMEDAHIRFFRVTQIARRLASLRVNAIQPAGRAEPERAASVFPDVPDDARADAVWLAFIMFIARQCAGFRVQTIDAFPDRANPDHAVAILMQAQREVFAQAVRVGGIMAVMREGFGRRIEPIQPARRADPDHAVSVFQQGEDGFLAQAVRLARLAAIDFKRIAVIAIQAVIRAKPEESAPVLQNGADAVLRQAVFGIQAVESNFPGSRAFDGFSAA